MNLSEVFEGEESSLRKTFDESVNRYMMNEEHNMTLRERWDEESKHYDIASSVRPLIVEFFLYQFDAMLAEDIEKIPEILPYQKLEKCTYCGKEYQFECSCADVLDTYRDQVRAILEARRLSIKK